MSKLPRAKLARLGKGSSVPGPSTYPTLHMPSAYAGALLHLVLKSTSGQKLAKAVSCMGAPPLSFTVSFASPHVTPYCITVPAQHPVAASLSQTSGVNPSKALNTLEKQ